MIYNLPIQLVLSTILVFVNLKSSKLELTKMYVELISCNNSLTETCSDSQVPSLADYADGQYFYGEQAEANQVGEKYLILKKEADLIHGFAYIRNSGYGAYCFQGEVINNQIVNVRVIDINASGNSDVYQSQTNIDLNSYYPLAEAETELNTQVWLEQCIQMFND